MKFVFCAAVLAAAVVTGSEEVKLGAGVSLREATSIKALVASPGDYVGKTVRVDGVATAVCEEMGCWMAVAAEGDPKGATVRLNVEDGVIVFPVSAKGKRVSAQGVLEEIESKDGHGKEAASEHAKHDAAASKRYQIKATGALIR